MPHDMEHDTEEWSGGGCHSPKRRVPGWDAIDTKEELGGDTTDTEGPGSE